MKERKTTKMFKKFCDFSGKVLDIGSGPIIPGYLLDNDNIELELCLDPLLSTSNPLLSNIEMIKGIGEYLPFENNSLDTISFATSFDHVINPINVLNEVKRVLKNNGILILWLHNDPMKNARTLSYRLKNHVKYRIELSKRYFLPKILKNYRINQETLVQQSKFIKSLDVPTTEDAFHLKHFDYSLVDKLCSELKF